MALSAFCWKPMRKRFKSLGWASGKRFAMQSSSTWRACCTSRLLGLKTPQRRGVINSRTILSCVAARLIDLCVCVWVHGRREAE